MQYLLIHQRSIRDDSMVDRVQNFTAESLVLSIASLARLCGVEIAQKQFDGCNIGE